MTALRPEPATSSIPAVFVVAVFLLPLVQACSSGSPSPASIDLAGGTPDLARAADLSMVPKEDHYVRCQAPCPLCVYAPTPQAPLGAACMPACGGACPAPSSGDAHPVCLQQFGFCALACDSGECPAGMRCLATMAPGLSKVCVWPVGG